MMYIEDVWERDVEKNYWAKGDEKRNGLGS
jgi:hypothetical protein